MDTIDVAAYWESPPPEPSPRVAGWVERIRAGWRPNRRLRTLGYHAAADFYGVYVWEYLHVLRAELDGAK